MSKITVQGRVASINIDANGFATASINVGEFQTLSERRVHGNLYIAATSEEARFWLGKIVTIEVNGLTQEAP